MSTKNDFPVGTIAYSCRHRHIVKVVVKKGPKVVVKKALDGDDKPLPGPVDVADLKPMPGLNIRHSSVRMSPRELFEAITKHLARAV